MNAAPDLLADLLSRDPHRVWSAAWGVLQTRDEAVLGALWPHLARLERRTAGLDLGGGLASNNEVLDIALKTLRQRRDGECRCSLYPQFSRYDPNRLAGRGDLRILSTSEPGYEMTYTDSAKLRNNRKRTDCCSTPLQSVISPARSAAQLCKSARISRFTSKPFNRSPYYVCRCEHCGQTFHVEQGEYHLPWWKWVTGGNGGEAAG